MITLDTSALFASFNRRDPAHQPVADILGRDTGPLLVPEAVLGEVAYFLETRLSPPALDTFLGDIDAGVFTLEPSGPHIPRIRELVARYADFPLGLVDAAVVACAERRGGRVLTTDFRHFGAVAREGRIALALPPRD